MWDLPRSGLEPVSPALAGGFLTTAPPGKSQECLFKKGFKEIKYVSSTNGVKKDPVALEKLVMTLEEAMHL